MVLYTIGINIILLNAIGSRRLRTNFFERGPLSIVNSINSKAAANAGTWHMTTAIL